LGNKKIEMFPAKKVRAEIERSYAQYNLENDDDTTRKTI
jgi:hypothetical protein